MSYYASHSLTLLAALIEYIVECFVREYGHNIALETGENWWGLCLASTPTLAGTD